jgi:ribosomal protein S18 acetylase RimI-like enzyme
LALELASKTVRPYAGESDLPRLERFLVRARAATSYCGYYHLGDLSWNLFLAQLRGEIPQHLYLWEDSAGELLGFAWYYPPAAVDIQVAPWHVDREALEVEMLKWALARRWEFIREDGAALRLSTEAFEDDERFLSVLDRLQFCRTPEHKVHMLWDLAQPVPPVVLPDGFIIRPLHGDDDLTRRAAVQKSVWPWSRVTAESYPALRQLPGYDPQLDLVCVAPDGSFAAFAICWLDTMNGVAEFEPVGTHPEFRGRGLGRALLWEALWRLQQREIGAALVYPMGGDVPAEALYRSAGFRPLKRQFSYSRPV